MKVIIGSSGLIGILGPLETYVATPVEVKEHGITISQSNTAFEPIQYEMYNAEWVPAPKHKEPKDYINGKKKYRRKY